MTQIIYTFLLFDPEETLKSFLVWNKYSWPMLIMHFKAKTMLNLSKIMNILVKIFTCALPILNWWIIWSYPQISKISLTNSKMLCVYIFILKTNYFSPNPNSTQLYYYGVSHRMQGTCVILQGNFPTPLSNGLLKSEVTPRHKSDAPNRECV